MTDGSRTGTGVVERDLSIDLLSQVHRRTTTVDWLVLLAIPSVLIGVSLVPRSIRLGYALAYQQPTLTTMFTAHFVHLSSTHLWTNLLAYALIVPLAYLFSLLADRRTEFYITFVTAVLSFPIALSVVNVVFVRSRIGLGFSGIVASFLGFLPLTLFWFLEARVDGRLAPRHAPVLFFLGTSIVAVWGIPRSPGRAIGAVIAVLAGALYLRRIAVGLAQPHSGIDAASTDGPVTFAGLGLSVFVVFVFAAFPADPTGDGTVVNLLLHLLGYCFGFIVPYTTFCVLGYRPDSGYCSIR